MTNRPLPAVRVEAPTPARLARTRARAAPNQRIPGLRRLRSEPLRLVSRLPVQALRLDAGGDFVLGGNLNGTLHIGDGLTWASSASPVRSAGYFARVSASGATVIDAVLLEVRARRTSNSRVRPCRSRRSATTESEATPVSESTRPIQGLFPQLAAAAGTVSPERYELSEGLSVTIEQRRARLSGGGCRHVAECQYCFACNGESQVQVQRVDCRETGCAACN